nr:hypothetical protein [Nocardia stercoris]
MDTQVYVVDTVVTKPGRAREFVDSYLRDYAPGARERGMTLERIVVSPPVWFPDASNTVTATWVLDGAAGWWAMTFQGRTDERVRQWWSGAADLIVERSRVTGAAAADVDELCGTGGVAVEDAFADSGRVADGPGHAGFADAVTAAETRADARESTDA